MILRDRIKASEGLVLHVYDDYNSKPIVPGYTVIGNPTIGYGRLITPAHGITQAEADSLLDADIAGAAANAATLDVDFAGLDEVRQGVLIEMVFEMGLSRAEQFHNTLAAIKRRDYHEAAYGMMSSGWGRQLPGRVSNLARIMETGQL